MEPELCPNCGIPKSFSEENARYCESCGVPFDKAERDNEVAYHNGLRNEAMRAAHIGDGDGLTLCPRCGGAETRNGALCLVCQNELRDDKG